MPWYLIAAENGENGDGGGGLLGGWTTFLPLIFIGVIFYFLLIRPQQRQRKEQQAMIESLKRGDEVVTIGGIHGRVEGLKDKSLVLKVAENVKIEINRASVAQIVKRRDEGESTLQDT